MAKRVFTSLRAALLACCAFIAAPAPAIPLSLTMVTDTLLVGRAILVGDYSALDNGFNLIFAKLADGSAPVHWSAAVELDKEHNASHPDLLNITFVEGRHISKPPPHPGELSPGPLLALGSILGPLHTALIDDFTGGLVNEVKVLHDNPLHFDIMTTTLIDLAPADPKSVTAGGSHEFRMVIDFRHAVPEPGSLLLLVGPLAMLALAGRRRAGKGASQPA